MDRGKFPNHYPKWFMLILIFVGLSYSQDFSDSDYPWTYQCNLGTLDGPACQRQEVPANDTNKVPLNICILTCGQYGGLWPYPSAQTILGKTLTGFNLNGLSFAPASIPDPTDALLQLIGGAETIFGNYMELLIPEGHVDPVIPQVNVTIQLIILELDTKLTLNTDESYNLTISNEGSNVKVSIQGATFFGVRHGLETLAQLIDFNAEKQHLQIVDTVTIVDKPAFRYRGVLLDTARNFVPISDIKRLIDGLSFNKMNILHWHLTDSNSFPLLSKRVPQMIKWGTFSSKKIYMPEQVQELLVYANQRGVKIIPEFDMPAHAGNGWQWGEKEGLGTLSFCVDAPLETYRDFCIQPPCGQLNPLNNNTYDILGELFRDFLDLFENDIFHMGGDEISFNCWLAQPEIIEWMRINNSTDLMDLWGIFQEKAHTKLIEANGGNHIDAIVWTSEMTQHARKYLDPENYVIQIWSKATDDITKEIYEEGYRVIFSNNDTVYLDHGYGPWRGNYVNPSVQIRTWQVIYANDILGQVSRQVGQQAMSKLYDDGKLLGGVATLWNEKGDGLNMDMKLWPRGAAYAERLWSNPISTLAVTQTAYPRLIHQRERLVKRGLKPDTLLPEACYNIWGFCDNLYF